MDKELFLNGSGVKDPTAYEALKDYKKKETVTMEIYPGDIVGTTKTSYLVLNTDNAKYVPVLRIYESSNGDEGDMAVKIGRQIRYVNPYKPQHLFRDTIKIETENVDAISSFELSVIRKAVADAIGIAEEKEPAVKEIRFDKEEELSLVKKFLTKAETERDVYKDLYLQLLEKIR